MSGEPGARGGGPSAVVMRRTFRDLARDRRPRGVTGPVYLWLDAEERFVEVTQPADLTDGQASAEGTEQADV